MPCTQARKALDPAPPHDNYLCTHERIYDCVQVNCAACTITAVLIARAGRPSPRHRHQVCAAAKHGAYQLACFTAHASAQQQRHDSSHCAMPGSDSGMSAIGCHGGDRLGTWQGGAGHVFGCAPAKHCLVCVPYLHMLTGFSGLCDTDSHCRKRNLWRSDELTSGHPVLPAPQESRRSIWRAARGLQHQSSYRYAFCRI